LRAALKELGYQDTYHMMSASVENPLDCLLWQDAFAAKFDGKGEFTKKNWDQLLGHCQVSLPSPHEASPPNANIQISRLCAIGRLPYLEKS
jgi:hypothetical protein